MKMTLFLIFLSVSILGDNYTKSNYNIISNEIIVFIGLLIIMIFLARVTIIGPLKRNKIKKQIEENRIINRIINRILKNKYTVNFKGEYTLMIYDFIKTNVEHVDNDIVSYDIFRKNDLLKEINLDEVYYLSMNYNNKKYLIQDKTVEEIDHMINASFTEIKYALAQEGKDFPLYNLVNDVSEKNNSLCDVIDIFSEFKEITKKEVELKIQDNRVQYEDVEATMDGLVYLFWITVLISILIYFFYYWKLGLFIGAIFSLLNFYYFYKSMLKQEKLTREFITLDWNMGSYL